MISDLEPHRRHLLDVAYRITGTTVDAEDVVQESFVRALATPPPDLGRSLRPWLVRVVANLARDLLRARKRRGYAGSWLPQPIEVEQVPTSALDPEAAVSRSQAVGWATLLALEALTPQQRTVLVLREVADIPAEELAGWLGTTAAAVRATHTRARRALANAGPSEPERLDEAMVVAMQRLSTAIVSGDLPALRAALDPGVTLTSDSGGEYRSAVRVLRGPDHVGRFLLGLARKNGETEVRVVWTNDRFAWVTTPRRPRRQVAPRGLLLLTLAADGRIAGIQILVASRKLLGLRAG